MQIVEVRFPSAALPTNMAAMRIWLDERRLQPSSFICDDAASEMRVAVTFAVATDAKAFAERFAGRLHPVPAAVAAGFETTDLVR